MIKTLRFFCFGLMLCLSLSQVANAQSTTITPGNSQPNLTATSTNNGVLVPQISLTSNLNSASPVTNPVAGLLVYNIGANQINGFYYWTGSTWQLLSASNPLSATAPISIVSNNVRLNAGTAAGQLLTWNGNNWVNTNPKPNTTIDTHQPYLGLNFCIALQGVFPPRNGPEPYVAEISIFGFNFAPNGWAMCNGQLISINQNIALFSLLGTTYGGNGQTTFALPDLRGRVPVHFGQGLGLNPIYLGEVGGAETVTFDNKY